MTLCACGRPADAGSTRDECRGCFRKRITSVGLSYKPSSHPDRDYERRYYGDLDRYASARRQGIQPKTTQRADVEEAVARSDATGIAYRADAASRST